jgi:hypothetical protein
MVLGLIPESPLDACVERITSKKKVVVTHRPVA